VPLPIETLVSNGSHARTPTPRSSSAMFMAELENLILTAGHDLDMVVPPVQVDVTDDDDRYVLLNRREAVLGPGDMMMADGAGIVSSVLRGPDLRTRITGQTRNVCFAAYAPKGVGAATVRATWRTSRRTSSLIAREARGDELSTLTAA
jgi:DNA/RNA-binding domain of Phe-tRNA-synthetase-like protein